MDDLVDIEKKIVNADQNFVFPPISVANGDLTGN